MAEQKTNMTDEQLAQELRKSKGGKLGGKILSLLGGVIAVAGMILGDNLVLVVIGGVVLGLGQMVQGKSKEQAGRQTFDSIAPDIVGTAFENVQMNPVPPLLDANDTNIPLPSHTHCSGSGYIRGTYRGLTTELCTVRLTEVSEFQREETGLWEKNEQEVYTGQWMLYRLNREFPTWLTIWPRDRLDKLFSSKTIQTGNEGFDKRFNLSSDDEAAALRILSPSRMERILALVDSSIGKFAVNLNSDGRLYIAVHSGRGFFDLDKGRCFRSSARVAGVGSNRARRTEFVGRGKCECGCRGRKAGRGMVFGACSGHGDIYGDNLTEFSYFCNSPAILPCYHIGKHRRCIMTAKEIAELKEFARAYGFELELTVTPKPVVMLDLRKEDAQNEEKNRATA